MVLSGSSWWGQRWSGVPGEQQQLLAHRLTGDVPPPPPACLQGVVHMDVKVGQRGGGNATCGTRWLLFMPLLPRQAATAAGWHLRAACWAVCGAACGRRHLLAC